MEERENYDNWKFGVIYYNPNDPLFFVKRRQNTGYTINFGNKRIYLLIIALALVVYTARRF